MLDQSALDAMRDAIAQTFPDACNILTATDASDGAGGITRTWGTTSANVPCRFDFKSGREMVTGGAIQAYTSGMVSIPYDAEITEVNRVEKIDIDLGSVSYTYAVVAPINSDQSWRAVKRVQVERV